MMRALRAVAGLALGAATALLALELGLRLLPVNHGWANPPVTAAMPVIRQRPGAAYTYSHGWDMRDVTSGRFNALGFPGRLSAPDGRPELDLVGDSFVEAAMIPTGERLEDRLNALQGGYRVNSFGMSGSDLPAYVVYARWAVQARRPTALVVNIVGGDVKGAVQPSLRGWWWTPKNGALVERSNLRFGARNALAQSRLLAYVLFNLRFGKDVLVDAFKHKKPGAVDVAAGQDAPAAAGVAPGRAAPARPLTAVQMQAAKRFVDEMAALQRAGTPVLLSFDADRQAIYRGVPSRRQDAEALLPLARAAGLQVLDLQPVFAADWALHHRRFDFGVVDAHWNAYGVEVVSRALAARLPRPAAGPETPAPGASVATRTAYLSRRAPRRGADLAGRS